MKRAYGQFNDELLEGCAKQSEFRMLIFALSYFHAVLLERKKFGVGNLPGATSGDQKFLRYRCQSIWNPCRMYQSLSVNLLLIAHMAQASGGT